MKVWWSYGWREWWINIGRRCDRRRKSIVRDRLEVYRVDRELVPETRWSTAKGTISYSWRGWCGWTSEIDKRWRASAARRLNRDEFMQIRRLGGCGNFVCKSQISSADFVLKLIFVRYKIGIMKSFQKEFIFDLPSASLGFARIILLSPKSCDNFVVKSATCMVCNRHIQLTIFS